LGLEIGKAAINPVPMKMIRKAITDLIGDGWNNIGISIIISVPNGEQISKRTDNPRLGILGGISILGTSGIVFPYSTSSFAASIRQSIDVSIAMNSTTVVLTTGGRSEDFIRQLFGDKIPDHSYIQVGDFIGYALKQCTLKRVNTAYVGGFIGKFTKMAMGIKQTHVKGSHVDMEFMAALASNCGSSNGINSEIIQANTARHVSEIISKYQIEGFYDSICKEAFNHLSKYCQDKIGIFMIMFDFDGKIIGEFPKIRIRT
jgi:cobalt-precorrin-5B (C1)-methyltransferase